MAANSRSMLRWAGPVIYLVLIFSACSPRVTAPPAAPAAVRRGDEAFHYQDYGSAIASYRIYLDQVDQGSYTARTFYKSALAQYRLGQYDKALTTLDELSQRYPKRQWVQVEALRGDIQRAAGHPATALQAWDGAWKIAGDADRPALRQRILVTARLLSDVELASAERVVTTKDVRKLLDQQIALREPLPINEPVPTEGEEQASAEEGSIARADLEAAPAGRAEEKPASTAEQEEEETAPPTPPVTTEAEPAAAETTEAVAAPEPAQPAPVQGNGKVACLFPLSGAARQFGERSLRGLRLAFGKDSDELIVRDTGGDAAAAARMFDELVGDPHVLAVIGPLQSNIAETLAPKANSAQVPLLLLSHGQEPSGQFVLQAGVTRAGEVAALLDYGMQKVRLRRFGVLYPRDQYGQELLDTFRAEVTRRGGTVVGTDAYAPGGAINVDSAVRTVRQWRDAQHVQAVFVPDRGPAVAEFAKSVQDKMPDVTLLGTHGWEDLADHDNSLNGVLFSDSFYSESFRPSTRAFVDAYQQAYGQIPGAAEAQAYDAGLLVRRALDAGASSRSDLWRHLHMLGPVDGATGEIDLTPDGIRRTLFLLQVCDGKLQEISTPVRAKLAEVTSREVTSPSQLETAGAPAEVAGVSPPQMIAAPPVGGAPSEPETAPAAAPVTTKVACLLPLTGPDAAYGKRSFAGLQLAFADARSQLVARDTGGNPETAATLLRNLESDPTVMAVIGPLRSSEAEATVPLAEREHIPLLLLSQRDGLAGRFALQMAMTHDQQTHMLVRYAIDNLNLRRFGVLYPNDAYGSAFAASFKEEVGNQGGEVVGMQTYEPGADEFAGAVATAKSWKDKGVEALFIPDAARTAAPLAAQVRRVLPEVALLGTESWNDAHALASAGSAIDGAIFADAFFVDSARPSTRRFVERFQRGAGRPPTVFEAEAFDAGLAVRQALAEGAMSRDQLVSQLRSMGSFEGTGDLRASPTGFQRAVSILRYRDGKIEEVTPGNAGD
jgi:ABC-type branched-subunit amino acid transport system substrate-binding protein